MKKILNIGCCGDNDNWKRHKQIAKKHNRYKLHGIDINSSKIVQMNQNGFVVKYHNLEGTPKKFGEFDIIYAEEIIEHVSNLGNFIKFIRMNLKAGGKIILTTPNCCRLNNIFRAILSKRQTESEYHIVAFNDYVLHNLFNTNGFTAIEIGFSNKDYPGWTNIFPKGLSSNITLTARYSQNTTEVKK